MRKIFLLTLSAALISFGALYAETKKGKISENLTISGTLIDNHCANAHTSGLDAFIKTHTKECAIMPNCAASGYSLYHYGALLRFNRESSRKIEQFLKNKASRLDVTVVVRKSGEEYSLISIKNK